MILLSSDGMNSIYDSDVLPQTQENQDSIDVPKMEQFKGISVLNMDIPEVVESETTQNHVLLLVSNECESLPSITSTETVPGEKNIILENMNDNALLDTPSSKCVITPSAVNKKWDATSRRNLKSRKHPALLANVPKKKTLFDELTQAILELVQLQKKFLEEEIVEKKKVWEFEENERKKEAEFKEKERKWKEEKYKLKLQNNFK